MSERRHPYDQWFFDEVMDDFRAHDIDRVFLKHLEHYVGPSDKPPGFTAGTYFWGKGVIAALAQKIASDSEASLMDRVDAIGFLILMAHHPNYQYGCDYSVAREL